MEICIILTFHYLHVEGVVVLVTEIDGMVMFVLDDLVISVAEGVIVSVVEDVIF